MGGMQSFEVMVEENDKRCKDQIQLKDSSLRQSLVLTASESDLDTMARKSCMFCSIKERISCDCIVYYCFPRGQEKGREITRVNKFGHTTTKRQTLGEIKLTTHHSWLAYPE